MDRCQFVEGYMDFPEKAGLPNVIGFHIANNLFHARKLSLQGETLD